ncbi:hypothetical protein LIMNO130_80097 [Limnobacter sp. 130]|nr:hypothetical protein LIMNO130_80097 [Limnobacter sp. 130]
MRFALQVIFVKCAGLGIHTAARENVAAGSMLERSQGGEMWGFLIRERGMRDHSLFLSLVIGLSTW